MDYDACAVTYEERYTARWYPGIQVTLERLSRAPGVARVLEAGCGTGHWLRELSAHGVQTAGVDRSFEMLRQAHARDAGAAVVNARAEELPLRARSFDLVTCINAFHHFDRPAEFIGEAKRVLRPGGRLAVVGLDPHEPGSRWYLYDYFPGTREQDLRRYLPRNHIARMLREAGLHGIQSGEAEHVARTFTGAEVLRDPFLKKHGTSQLAVLTDAEYAAGMERIRRAADAEQTFAIELKLFLVSGAV